MGADTTGTGLPWVEAIADSFPHHAFSAFHTTRLPALNAERRDMVADDLAGVPPLAFRVPDGRTYTWIAGPDGVRAVEGDADAATLVELDEATFSEYVNELLTANGCVRTQRAEIVRGGLEGWKRWEPATRALLTGRPIYTGAVWDTLVDRDGAPLDLHRSFPADGDREEIRHFLDTAGFVHIKGVYDAAEIAQFGAEVEYVRSQTTPGDGLSWWSVNSDGDEVVTRINYLGRHSDVLQQLCFEPRMTELARLADPAYRVCDDRLDGPMVFVKSSNVVKGSGDLGWHTDDGIGGHPVLCPLIQAGIQLDHANPANGQLMVLAGSHRYVNHWLSWGDEGDLPVVRIETEPGDLTLHFGDIMHSTPPPTGPAAGRRALYYKFSEQKTFDWVPSGCHYNDALFHADKAGRIGARATTH
ncbi:phytanoyl-CoA dioxygenase family protein [Yinghuangia seranimata]|uniref:phytanoyl-CoA dioxygenase family protein n=1 Tax=Yinghuangia seranimata TaxID=408067 RepID=UPI00248B5814|nr:phytanoyl-CoA dioxygenase family protein [Yinghuangia seranimata]MDI2126014.1 phytanoyl-CoA dioxygenase family protein [Yinghuangia seranimata]